MERQVSKSQLQFMRPERLSKSAISFDNVMFPGSPEAINLFSNAQLYTKK